MNWRNLAKNKCPKCNGDFTKNMQAKAIRNGDTSLILMVHKCGFRITERKFKEIVSGMVSQDLEKEGEEVVE